MNFLPPCCLRSLVAALLVVTLLPSLLCAATDDERFLEGLRERRLFRVAEAYCLEKLADPKVDETARAVLTIELLLTLSQRATYLPPAERQPYWQRCRAVVDAFPREHPRKLVVDLQGALVVLAQGELARQEAEASNAEDFSGPQGLLRDAGKQLDDLERRLTQQIAQKRDNSDKAALTAAELFSLQHNVRYQLARTRRNQGLCYPPKSNDRVAALTQAIEQLGKLRTQLAADEPLAWRVSIDEGICQRLLEDYAAASGVLNTVLANNVAATLQSQARAELARIALATGQASAAQRILDTGRNSAEMSTAEFEFAQLEVYVAQWKQADSEKDTQNAGRFRQQAVNQLATIERNFGAYWARRGEWLVIGSAGAGEGNLEILAKTADARFLKNQFDAETVKIYDQAATMALAEKNLPRYLELAYRAAIVQQRQKELLDAARRCLKLGETVAEHADKTDALVAKGAAAHLQGLQWLKASATQKEERTELASAYERHLQLFAGAPTHGAIALELAAAQEEAEDWPAAIATYKTIAATDDQYAAASLRAARLTLEHTDAGYAQAEELLTAAIEGAAANDHALRDNAQALLVVALAGQPQKRASAEKLLLDLGTDSPARLLEMLDGLTKLSQASGPKVRRDMSALQLRAIELVEPSRAKLTAVQQLALSRIHAEALLAAGKPAEALAAYEALAKQQPGSAAIQEGYAVALASSDDRATLTKALAQWRSVAQRTKPQTDRWYRAKYEVAHLNFRLGDKAQAAQLIKYLQATPPGLAGTPLERQFAELLSKCES